MSKPSRRTDYASVEGRPRDYITVARAAELAQCSETSIWRLIWKRRVGVIRWRHRVLLSEKDLREWSRVRRYRRRPHPRSVAPPPPPVLTPPVATEEVQVQP